MSAATDPEDTYERYIQQVELFKSVGRTGAPTQDPSCAQFYGMPYDDFTEILRASLDELEQSAYLMIIASSEAVLQLDFRARAGEKASVPLQREARGLRKREKQRRIGLEDVLDAWKKHPLVTSGTVSEFKQLLPHRHWLAHGRYFRDMAPVSADPGFAIARFRALRNALQSVDSAFPRH
jgi:hypothetical protein